MGVLRKKSIQLQKLIDAGNKLSSDLHNPIALSEEQRSHRIGLKKRLLRVGYEVEQVIPVSLNQEIKPPVAVHPALPNVPCFVVLLGLDRRMARVLDQECELLVARSPDLNGSVSITPLKTVRIKKLHLGNSALGSSAQRPNNRGR